MPRVQFVGQISLSFGNTLPELCSKLKNFGVGRMFVRTAKDQNPEVSYVVLTKSRPMITQTPPKAIVGELEEISVITKKPPDTQSEFFGKVVERGILLNEGREMKISSAINPDWRLILRQDEAYYKSRTQSQQTRMKAGDDRTKLSPLQRNIGEIIKFWARAKG